MQKTEGRRLKMTTYDRANVIEFKTKYEEGEYTCNVCGQTVSLDDCVSSRGYNLVCNKCVYRIKRVLGKTDILNDIHKVGLSLERTDKYGKE